LTNIPATTFIRDRFTWLAYLMLAYFAYMQTSVGTLMPFLRDELGLSYTVGALHMSALALGMVLTGSVGDRAAVLLGRGRVFWGGAIGMALGAIGLMLGSNIAVTIPSAFSMGVFGTLLIGSIQATLADHHGTQRTIAFTESNIAASILAALAPLLIGIFQRSGVGWRAALVAGIALLIGLALALGRIPIPAVRTVQGQPTKQRLPRQFWLAWLVIVLAVSIEWCLTFWGNDFLRKAVGLTPADAATLMGIYFGAIVLGRIVGSRLSRHMSDIQLLWGVIGLTIVGFPLFWLANLPIVNITGLFLMGLGIANLFPLSLTIAIDASAGQTDAASARATLGSGLAILILPLVLGRAADAVGVRSAFVVEAILLLVLVAMLWVSERTRVREQVKG
jgi:MFS family permease